MPVGGGNIDGPATDRPGHIGALDGLRFLAAYIVFLSHFSNETNLFSKLLGSGAGQIGVMIFFLLSGFLMGHLYLSSPCNWSTVKRFAGNRVARIAPLYYSIVLASIAATAWGHPGFLFAIKGGSIVHHLFLIKGDSVLWTIPVEMQFYAAFIALWFVHSKSKIGAICIVAVLIYVIVLFYSRVANWQWQLLHFAHFFLTGVLVSLFAPLARDRLEKLSWGPRVSDFGFVVSLALVILSYPQIYHRVFGVELLASGWGELKVLMACATLLATAAQSRIATSILASRGMAFGGAISYSIYLLHIPVMMAVKSAMGSDRVVLLFIACNAIVMLVAVASYYLIELPSQRYLRGWFANTARLAAPEPGLHLASDNARS